MGARIISPRFRRPGVLDPREKQKRAQWSRGPVPTVGLNMATVGLNMVQSVEAPD
jgi:hypothetical protein